MAEYIVDIDAIWDLFGSGIVDKSEVHESIIRCRDCVRFGYEGCGYFTYDNGVVCWSRQVEPDGFCAWGEPKDGE